MVTITLHDAEAIEVLTTIRIVARNRTAKTELLEKAARVFECALLICECDRLPSETK